MSAEVPHAADADLVEHGEHPADAIVTDAEIDTADHDQATHMDVHTALSDDDHGHAVMELGPLDWGKWAFALGGGLAGLLVVVAFWVALN